MDINNDGQTDGDDAPELAHQQATALASDSGSASLGSKIGGLFRGADGTGVRWTSIAVVAVLALVVGILGWNWYSSNKPSDEVASTASAGPVLMTADQLKTVASSAGHSIYWAGPRDLKTYEVSIVGKDVYVRYLPATELVGSKTPFLTVGTYEKVDAYAGLQKAATVAGAKSGKLTGGAFVVVPADKPTSAYFAFEGHNLLMEVYDPTPGEALKLVTSGAVNPIS